VTVKELKRILSVINEDLEVVTSHPDNPTDSEPIRSASIKSTDQDGPIFVLTVEPFSIGLKL